MLRSQINAAIERAKSVLRVHGFHLPPFAFWTPEEWRRRGAECDEIRACKLGWDVTDFASGDFARVGLTAFTLRNGAAAVALSPHRLLRKGDDRRRGPAHADALPCGQAGGHHLPRRRQPDLPGLQPPRRRPPRRQRSQRVARRDRAPRAGGASLRHSPRRIDPADAVPLPRVLRRAGRGNRDHRRSLVGQRRRVRQSLSRRARALPRDRRGRAADASSLQRIPEGGPGAGAPEGQCRRDISSRSTPAERR